MKRITMRIKADRHTIETTGFTGKECRTPQLQQLNEVLGVEVVSDMDTPEASRMGLRQQEFQDA